MRLSSILDPAVESALGHTSLSQRRELAVLALDLFRQHPLTGVGVGMFKQHAGPVNPGGEWLVAHNTYLNAAAEQGALGLASHALAGALILWLGGRLALTGSTPWLRSAGMGFLLAMVGFGAMAATLNLVTFAMAYWVLGVGGALFFASRSPGLLTNPSA